MDKKYTAITTNRTARPRSKRLREQGIGGSVSSTVILNGEAGDGGTAGGGTAGGGTAGDGHTHANKPALDQITTDSDGYQYLTQYKEVEDPETGETEVQAVTEKVKAGFADLARDLTEDSPVREQFLSRLADDVAKGNITFEQMITVLGQAALKGGAEFGAYQPGKSGAKVDGAGNAELLFLLLRRGLESVGFSTGALGSGFCLKTDGNGDSYLEVDRMLVRKAATFVELIIQRLRHVGGQIILSPASMHCAKVEEYGTYYRCYFEQTDGERSIAQEFVAGDQARCQTFNLKQGAQQNAANSYYWRLVTGTGENYIDLSKADSDAGSTAPRAGDDIVQLGNRDSAERQAAIVLAAYGEEAPYLKLYRGINSYSLAGKEFVNLSRQEVMIVADRLKFSTGETVKEYIEGYVEGSVKDSVKDLSVGGRNYFGFHRGIVLESQHAVVKFDDSPEVRGAIVNLQGAFTENNIILRMRSFGLQATGTYTLSMDIQATEAFTLEVVTLFQSEVRVQHSVGKTWSRLVVQGEIFNVAIDYISFRVALPFNTVTKVTLRNVKLEKGNVATDWTPAPEDLQYEVEHEADQVRYEVKQVQETVMEAMEGQITLAVNTTKEYADTRRIGGRNLMLGTREHSLEGRRSNMGSYATEDGVLEVSVMGAGERYVTVDYPRGFTREVDFAGKRGVLSMDMRTDNPGGAVPPSLAPGGDKSAAVPFKVLEGEASGGWERIYAAFTLEDYAGMAHTGWDLRFDSASIPPGCTYEFRRPKLEAGDYATGWTEAPEDAEQRYEEYADDIRMELQSSINVMEDRIDLKVSRSEYTEALSNQSLLAMAAAGKVAEEYRDPTFKSGNNHIEVNKRDSWTGTLTRMVGATPSDSGVFLRIEGTGTDDLTTYGNLGFRFAKAVDAIGRHTQIVVRFTARLAAGREFYEHPGTTGTGGSCRWLTSNQGTGEWQEYALYVKYGESPAYGKTPFFRVPGMGDTVIDLAYATIVDITSFEETVSVETYETGIEQLADQINLRATKTALDNLAGRVASAESSLTVQAGQIASKVSATDYNGEKVASLINQSAESVKIQAGKVDLEGKVTLSMLSGNGTSQSIIEGGKIKADLINVEALLARDIVATGSMRSPFSYAPTGSYADYSDNVAVISEQGGEVTDAYNLQWNVEQSGRKLCIVNYKWKGMTAEGWTKFQAPAGKYFFENGVGKSELYLSRECVELLGYGDDAAFYGWIVLQRTNLMTTYRYGRPLNCLAMGKVTVDGSSIQAAVGLSFDGSELTVRRIATGRYRITLPSGWVSKPEFLFVMAVGTDGINGGASESGDANKVVKATVCNLQAGQFDICTSDDATANDGSFQFFVFNLGDWLTEVGF